MKLHNFRVLGWLTLGALQLLLAAALQAAPLLDLRQQDVSNLRLDIRNLWQIAMLPGTAAAAVQPLDAQAVWALPDSTFKPGLAAPVQVNDNQRFVGRMSVMVSASSHSLLLELPMPRLNMAHASYRYNNEAWTQLSAGDQLPMVQWPVVNRNPVFFIPSKTGELQIILDIPVPGLFPSPVVLMGDPVFRAAQTARNLQSGAALGLSFVTVLFCIGAGLILKRIAFAAVGLYAISIFLVTAGQGGIFGMYIGTTTAWFNDYIKYVTGIIFGAAVPWTISLVTAQKHYSRLVANAATFWLFGSLLAMLVMLPTVERETQWTLLAPFLVASLVFGVGIALASAMRLQQHGVLALAAALLLCAGIFAPIAAYWGYLDGTFSFSVSALCFLMSTTLLLLAVLLQYRHGNRVIARAQRSPGRDALTGLLNRDVFERKLARVVRDSKTRNVHALFLYIAVNDRDSLEARFGGEGFESGMVQMAAALSSSISVVDTVARISTNAFGVLVVMSPDLNVGNALAQKLITRIMAVASHSAPMAQTARIAAAWVPNYAHALPALELAARKLLQNMDAGKRIEWLGGAQARGDQAAATSKGLSPHTAGLSNSRPRSDQLHSLINGIEDTMRNENFAASNEKARGLAKKLFQSQKPPQ